MAVAGSGMARHIVLAYGRAGLNVLLLLALPSALLAPVTALASELSADAEGSFVNSVDNAGVASADPVVAVFSSGLAVTAATGDEESEARRVVRIHDVATKSEVAPVTLPSPVYYPMGGGGGHQDVRQSGSGGLRGSYGDSFTVDDAGGRLFAAYEIQPRSGRRSSLAINQTIAQWGPTTPQVIASNVVAGHPCVGVAQVVNGAPCVGGVHVVDVRAGEFVRSIPLRPIRVDTPGFSPALRGMVYSPPRPGESGSGKLHLLVEDLVYVVDGTTLLSSTTGSTRDHTLQNSLWYLVQFDIDSGAQEWAVRVDACRGGREGSDVEGAKSLGGRPHGSALLRVSQSAAGGSLWVGCFSGRSLQSVIVRVPLDADGRPAALPLEPADPVATAGKLVEHGPGSLDSQDVAGTGPGRQEAITGPEFANEYIVDRAGGRILLRTNPGNQELWWVFDVAEEGFVGAVGIGTYHKNSIVSGLDPATGRLYVVTPDATFVADSRRTPLPQALVTAPLPLWFEGATSIRQYDNVLHVMPAAQDGQTWLLGKRSPTAWSVFVDRVPVSVDPEVEEEFAGRTLDLDEMEGVTASSYDGAARGFGFRAILVGGAEAMMRASTVDPYGTYKGVRHRQQGPKPHGSASVAFAWDFLPDTDACLDSSREVVAAFVGPRSPAAMDAGGSKGGVQPLVLDGATGDDAERPVARCSPVGWEDMWGTALFGRPAVAEPEGVSRDAWDADVSCVSSDEEPVDSWGDPVSGKLAGRVECHDEEAGGWAQARGISVEGVSVAESLSSFRIYLDPGRGLVSMVESVARGISLDGVVTIDTVRGKAESWANGRRQPAAAAERGPGYQPNCDIERTAGTCLQRHLFGVRTPGYSCGPCGDERAAVEAIARALGTNAEVQLRDPDSRLAKGAQNGFMAAIQKPDGERFADLMVKNDLLQTTLPTLEITRAAAGFKHKEIMDTYAPTRGRQTYQFAGVEVSSSYSIQCLLVYDEESNTCAAPVEEPGSIVVGLQDPRGVPLAGGGFEVRADADDDGVLGLVDTLVRDGTCVTADDGVGTCRFESLPPGSYLVSQVAAPAGYAKSDEPWVSQVGAGEARTVTFTNVSNESTVELSARDADGDALSGAVFSAYPDPDSDGKVAPDTPPAASCTTDEAGVCTMRVPAGSYVLVQTTAPGGLERMEPVPFTFASGGQVAAVTVTNYPPQADAAAAPVASPVYTPAVEVAPPVESVGRFIPAAPVEQVAGPVVSLPEQVGGTVVRIIRAPREVLRLLARGPLHAAAWVVSLLVFTLALAAVRRRMLLGSLTATPAYASTGPRGSSGPPRHHGGGGGGRHAGPPRPPGPGGPPRPGPNGAARPRPSGLSDRPGSSATLGTAVLDRPVVAGGAPRSQEGAVVAVVIATEAELLAAVVAQRFVASDTCELVATATSFDELRSVLGNAAVDVVVVDLALPAIGSEDVCDLLSALHPLDRTVGLVPPNRSAQALVRRGYQAGLGGLLVAMDDIGNGQLAYAARCVATGKPFYGPSAQAVLLHPGKVGLRREKSETLTPRELEIARLVAAGAGRKEIAERLFLSPGTVKGYLRAIRAKLGVTNPRDARQVRDRLAARNLLPARDATEIPD